MKMRDMANLIIEDADALPRYRRPRRASGPASVLNSSGTKVDPIVLKTALKLARGNRARLIVNPEGSVTVANSADHRQLILARRRSTEGNQQ